jgi:iron(III) transport system substrate-binding protein
LPSAYRTDAFWGTRILNLVIIHKRGMKNPPTGWSELISAAYHNQVAVPDPAFAGSAFAALGYFGLSPSFGMDFYRKLRANGAVQVESIPDVVNDVAEGRYRVGIALDNSARAAIKKGSPLQVVWPSDGAIALYSPIAVFKESPHRAAAKAFVNYVLTPDAQSRIAGTGWEPILPGVNGPRPPAGATQVYPDWTQAYGRQAALLEEYRAIFGA